MVDKSQTNPAKQSKDKKAPQLKTLEQIATAGRSDDPNTTPIQPKNQLDGIRKKQVHIILQGKGGVGKSLVAYLLQQHFSARGLNPIGIDTDPVNATFDGYEALNVEHLVLMDDDGLNPQKFDALIEQIASAPDDAVFVIDNGAATFLPLCQYLVSNEIVELLTNLDCEIFFHTVLTFSALIETANGFQELLANFPDSPVCVWLNEYLGRVEMDNKQFKDTPLYLNNKDNVRGLVKINKLDPATFGYDFANMLQAKLTFEEVKTHDDFKMMSKHRINRVWGTLNSQIAALDF